jgi:hypothetical protein
MEAHEYYEKETGKLYYKGASLELELTDDYINWLERNVVKLFAIPAVVGRSEQFGDVQKSDDAPNNDKPDWNGNCWNQI